MNPDYCSTDPKVSPTDIEWVFCEGMPALVAHIPNADGVFSAIRLDQIAPESHYEREFIRALLRIAERVMEDSEPARAALRGDR